MFHERARAKINLSLRVLGRAMDGWHELESFVAFAGIGDHLSFEPAAFLRLAVSGPTAEAAGPNDANLVIRAARELATRVRNLQPGCFQLHKILPAAAGMGGGSADAAAALRLLAAQNKIALNDPRVTAAAEAIGADVSVCLESKCRIIRGRGEILDQPTVIEPLVSVLVNAGVPLATEQVFRELGIAPGATWQTGTVSASSSLKDIRRIALEGRNDLQAAAIALAPSIQTVLDALARTQGLLAARMTGSGGTCFGLFVNRGAASRAASAIAFRHPSWWVRATLLR